MLWMTCPADTVILSEEVKRAMKVLRVAIIFNLLYIRRRLFQTCRDARGECRQRTDEVCKLTAVRPCSQRVALEEAGKRKSRHIGRNNKHEFCNLAKKMIKRSSNGHVLCSALQFTAWYRRLETFTKQKEILSDGEEEKSKNGRRNCLRCSEHSRSMVGFVEIINETCKARGLIKQIMWNKLLFSCQKSHCLGMRLENSTLTRPKR